jgi:outer membrane lipoprotein-sorting protein
MKLILVLLPLFISYIGFSQNAYETKETSDPAATEILDKISNHLSAQKAIRIDFSVGFQTSLNDNSENQKGLIIQSGDKYFLAYANQTIVSNGALLWVYQQDFNEVSISNVDLNDSGFMLNPSTFLNFYKTMDVSYALIYEGKEDGKQIEKIEFKPLDQNQVVSKLRMTTDKANNKIIRIKAFLKDGSVYTLFMDKYTLNPVIEEGLFSFNTMEYEGIHVEDLRID